MILQNYLINGSFLCLLVSVVLVWVDTLNSGILKGVPKKTVAVNEEPSLRSSENSNISLFLKNNRFASWSVGVCNILLSCLLILRWKESGHFPLSNLYESLMFLSWCFTAFYISVNSVSLKDNYRARLQPDFPLPLTQSASFSSSSKSRVIEGSIITQKLIGCVTIPCALLCNAFASFSLPKEMQEVSPLVPALQSNWLMMHVSVMILSYGALIVGSLMSIAFLIVSKPNFSTFKKSNLKVESGENTITNVVNVYTNNEINVQFQNKQQKIALMLDNLSYRILALGFPLLTIGILSGAVWANEAWGSYWSWDPKETWALLTWLVFAVYLHTRLSKGWEGEKPAIVASFGFFIVWMCYLGVNLIGEGLHSYGWIVKS